MDIHRCRFIDYPPTAINALAFSHSYDIPGKKHHPLRLALGRANGNIEIWNPQNGDWIHEITLYGGQGRSIDDLAWVRDPDETDDSSGKTIPGRLRLFSTGYASEITEWDLTTGLPRQRSTGSHSEIWCLAAQPAWDLDPKGLVLNPTKQNTQDLVVGCADGSLAQFSTVDGELAFKRFIARASTKKARALSVTFQNRNRVIAGYSNSVIRVYDLKNLQMLRSIHVGGSGRNAPKDTLVWSLECLCDGTLVSGDSMGEVAFWDAQNFGQLSKFKSHEADVLCLASSHDGKTIFSGGMDRRTCVYSSNPANVDQRFKLKQQRRLHLHDVKAISRYDGAKSSTVVSGGADGIPVIVPLHNFESEYHRKLPFTPQTPPVAGSDRLIVSWWENQVGVWSIASRDAQGTTKEDASYKELMRMSLKSEEHITSASVSASGRLLAVSTISSTKLFVLTLEDLEGTQLKATKIDTPSTLSIDGARLTQLSPDAKWLLTIDGCENTRIHRVREQSNGHFVLIEQASRLFRHTPSKPTLDWLDGEWGRYRRTITRAQFSPDSRRIAVSDITGSIDSWVLDGKEDLSQESAQLITPNSKETEDSDSEDDEDEHAYSFYGQHWRHSPQMPRLDSMPLVLSFRESKEAQSLTNGHSARQSPAEDRLVVLTSTHKLYEIHTSSGVLSEWSRRNDPSYIPDELRLQKERAIGGFVENDRGRIWLYSATWLCMISLEHDLKSSKRSTAELSRTDKKRKRTSSLSAGLERPNVKKLLEARRGLDGAAGDKVRPSESGSGVTERGYRKLDADGKSEFIEQQPSRKLAPFEDDDQEDEVPDDDKDAEDLPSEDDASTSKQTPSSDAFYITLRYRPILGLVPLQTSARPKANGSVEHVHDAPRDDTLEVALIERPLHDVDLGPRYVGSGK